MRAYLPAKLESKLNTNHVETYHNGMDFRCCPVCIFHCYHKFILLLMLIEQYTKYQNIKSKAAEHKCEASYWQSCHDRAIKREKKLKKENEHLKAMLVLREQQLFAKKTEKNSKHNNKENQQQQKINPRGQQKGSKGHGRTNNECLPHEHETIDINDDLKKCPCCGLPYQEFKTEDSEIISIIDVQAHKRIIHRKRYKKCCNCAGVPKIITASSVPKLIAKGKLDISVWVKILHEKYKYQIPINRLLSNFRDHKIFLAQGTITDGLKKITPLFLPIYNAIQNKCLEDKHWHADESRWLVFQVIADKVGNRWYLWVFISKQAVVFKIAPSRSSAVAKSFFGDNAAGILSVDRYVAYKVIAKDNLLVLAFCWAHVRRDFINHGKQYPKQEPWSKYWVDSINELYHINNQRTKYEETSPIFIEHNKQLREKIQLMESKRSAELEDALLHPKSKKILASLKNHWDGLTVFVNNPFVPMDNNTAERQLRNPIVGRKNYYGSGSVWSSELSAMLFSIFETLKIHKINSQDWLTSYLQTCAENKGKPPDDINAFLPWNITEKRAAA